MTRPAFLSRQAVWARTPTCGGACRQGRNECLTPEACRVPDDDSKFGAIEGYVKGIFYILAPWAVIGLVALAAILLWS